MSTRQRRRWLAAAGVVPAALAGALVAMSGCAADAPGEPPMELDTPPAIHVSVDPAALAARFLTDSTAVILGDTVGVHRQTRSFYAERGFAAAWTDPSARDSMAADLGAVEGEGIRPTDLGTDRLATIDPRGALADSTIVDADLLLTDGYFRLADALLGRRFDVREIYRTDWYPALRGVDAALLLRSALSSPAPGEEVARMLRSLRPADPEYDALSRMLARALADTGEPMVPAGMELAPGDTSDVVPTLRRRLTATGDWNGRQRPITAERTFDEHLSEALRGFQQRRGLEPSGRLDEASRLALNTPARDLVPLLALNLERWRWAPAQLGERHVLVNIPSYELELRRWGGRDWVPQRTMNVVVGGPGRWRTPVFSDTISQVVFSPTWTIPASIQMESYGRVDPRGMVRGPGPANPLGRVKFVFPNPYGIYLHDTNARARLGWEYRALSHGCIRLGDPRGLAEDLLSPQGWDSTRVATKFSGPWTTEPVDLASPLPVHLLYLTVRPGHGGELRRYPDVYEWDAPLARALGFSDEALEAARAALPMVRHDA